MRETDSPHLPGTVGVICGSLARYRALFTSIERLKVPRGTNLIYAEGADIAQNCNSLVKHATGDWLWIMGDDHRFGSDLLLKLLDHKVDVVVPITCRRRPLFHPVIYKIAALDGSLGQMHSWPSLQEEHSKQGLITVDAAGTAGMLIKKQVLDVIDWPQFEWQRATSEDIVFCWKIRRAGFAIHADLNQTMGHITSVDLEPKRDPATGEWTMTLTIDGYKISLGADQSTNGWVVKQAEVDRVD